MGIELQDWKYEDYLAFLLLYAANADLNINEKEKKYMESRVGRSEYEKVLALFEELNDVERIDVIVEFKRRYCKDENALERIISDFRKMLEIDHPMDAEEEAIFIGLKRLLKSV